MKTESEIVQFFDNLEARYQDEKEYESFDEYMDAAKKFLGPQFIGMVNNPFTLNCKLDGTNAVFKVVDNNIIVEKGGPIRA